VRGQVGIVCGLSVVGVGLSVVGVPVVVCGLSGFSVPPGQGVPVPATGQVWLWVCGFRRRTGWLWVVGCSVVGWWVRARGRLWFRSCAVWRSGGVSVDWWRNWNWLDCDGFRFIGDLSFSLLPAVR